VAGPGFPGGTEDYRGLKSASYSTQRIAATIIPPVMRITKAAGPLPYSLAVNEPFSNSHLGNRNQARGEISINAALTAMTTTTTQSRPNPKDALALAILAQMLHQGPSTLGRRDVTEVEKKRRGLQRMQLPPGNWFAPPGTNASSRRLSESSEMHVHA